MDHGQAQMSDVKLLERGDDWQCPSVEKREKARNEIHETANLATTGHSYTYGIHCQRNN